MGLEYSCIQILSSLINNEGDTITKQPDGTIIEKRKNPFVTPTAIIAVTSILIVCIDNGKGTLSKTFGHVCIKCLNQ